MLLGCRLAMSARPVSAGEETLEPVVVNGATDAADPQRLPASVSVLSGEDIQAAGIQQTGDVAVRTPNLVLRSNGGRDTPFFFIRGIGNTNQGQPGVDVYLDGMPYGDLRFRVIDLFDVEGIEVYRGPQATRFGRNAEGGAISLMTHQPGDEPEVQASVRYGSYASEIFQASASGPVVKDKVFISVAGLSSERHGYIENAFLGDHLDDRELVAGRGKLLLVPIPDLEIMLTGEVQDAQDGGRAFVLLHQPDPFEVRYNVRGRDQTEAYFAGLRVAYTTSAFRLTSIATRQSYTEDHEQSDFDFTPAAVAEFGDDYAFDNWTEEVRLASPDASSRWRWQIGGYFEDKDTQPKFTVRFDDTDMIQAPPPDGLGLPFTAPVRDVQHADIDSRTAAAFAESTVTLIDPLDLTAGLRYEAFDSRMHRTHLLVAAAQDVTTPIVPAIARSTHSSAWLPETTLAYHVTPPVTVYATVARAYRPGGLAPLTDNVATVKYHPEFDVSYELGVKSTWLDGRVTANAALFDLEIHDYQVIERVGLSSFTVANASRATSRGAELDCRAALAPGLEGTVAFGYTDARYDRYHDATTGERFDGNDVQLVPQYTFTIALEYRHPWGFLARAEYQGVGGYPFLEDNVVGQDAYQLFNSTLGYETERFGIYAFGDNLTNTRYFYDGIPGGPGGDLVTTPGDPRTYGVEVAYRY